MENDNKILQISVDDIIPNRFQPRLEFDEKALNELANSIKEHGIIQPLVVRQLGDKYEIIAGERRYKASQMAGLSHVPAIVKNITDKKSAELAVVENLQRKALSPIEEAQSYQKFLENEEYSQEELARKLGISQPTVANKIRLLGLADEVQEALLKNKISERHARSLLKLQDEVDQVHILNKILEERLTVKQTEELIRNVLSKRIIEPLAQGEKPVEVENIPNANEINDIYLSNKEEKQEAKKLDISSLLMPEGEEKTTPTQNLQETSSIENIDLPTKSPVEYEDIENITPIEENIKNIEPTQESEILNFNTQINPFQEPEVLDFEISSSKNKSSKKPEVEEEKTKNENEIQQHDLVGVINTTRDMVKKIEKAGFTVNTEEFDFEDMYQITIKVQKE